MRQREREREREREGEREMCVCVREREIKFFFYKLCVGWRRRQPKRRRTSVRFNKKVKLVNIWLIRVVKIQDTNETF